MQARSSGKSGNATTAGHMALCSQWDSQCTSVVHTSLAEAHSMASAGVEPIVD